VSAGFRDRLRAREVLIGSVLATPSPECAEILAASGLDWLFIDTEHGPGGPLEAQRLLQAAGGAAAGIVRVPVAADPWIKKVLDIGADGVIAPQVNSAADARRVVSLARYPPAGTRGVGMARAQGYGSDAGRYLESANERVAVIVQAEHIEAVRNIEAIVAVEGVDGVLVGPYDLSASLGRPGALDHPEVVAAIDRVLGACLDAGMAAGIFGRDAAAVAPRIEQGYTLVAVGTDASLLAGAARDTLVALGRSA